MMFPGLHPMAMMSTVGLGNYGPQQRVGGGGGGGAGPHGAYGAQQGGGGGAPPPLGPGIPPSPYPASMVPPPYTAQPPVQESSYLYIPNAAVGAVIGTKGTH